MLEVLETSKIHLAHLLQSSASGPLLPSKKQSLGLEPTPAIAGHVSCVDMRLDVAASRTTTV